MDQLQRVGASVRAVRVKRGWTQERLAQAARVSRPTITRLERGHVEGMQVGTLVAVAKALDMRISISARWRAGDLDRLLNGAHSQLHESVAGWFATDLPEWILVPEVSFAVFAERGVIDILAWHPGRRALLIIELKTDIVDVNELIGTMDVRRRLARTIARERGWDPVTISTWAIVAGGRTNQARMTAHRSMLRNAFPVDGRSMRRWLRAPTSAAHALSTWWRPRGSTPRGRRATARR